MNTHRTVRAVVVTAAATLLPLAALGAGSPSAAVPDPYGPAPPQALPPVPHSARP